MTPPTPDIAVSEERVNELREWLTSLTSGSDDDIRADLLSILDDYASLRAENELLNNNAMNDYAAHLELKARAEKADDKLAEVTKLWSTAERDATHLYARMMKAEAQLAKVCERNRLMDDNFGSLLEKNIKLEEELAKQAPLIEAVMGAKHLPGIINNLEFLVTKFTKFYPGAPEELAILRAALALREGEK